MAETVGFDYRHFLQVAVKTRHSVQQTSSQIPQLASICTVFLLGGT